MYYKLSEEDLELIEYFSNITGVNYELEGNMFPMESFIPLLRDLKIEIDLQEERIKHIKENSRPLTNKELYGDCED